ncbi:hypothetical protein MycrhDRAFT_6540 [Mycolicibacterium rhodesiae JS60]|nr:hypothetical protein MycrhDRAFT_6540 [Mycolicibacterium rhodesiae JS60]
MIRFVVALLRRRDSVCVDLYLPARQRVTIVLGERAVRREAS